MYRSHPGFLRLVLAALFIATGFLHFFRPDFFLRMMPPVFPAPLLLVHLSGVAEIIGGGSLLFPRYRVYSRWFLVALLLAIFPANFHMALHPELFPEFTPTGLWLRLPFQLVFIAWVCWVTREAANP